MKYESKTNSLSLLFSLLCLSLLCLSLLLGCAGSKPSAQSPDSAPTASPHSDSRSAHSSVLSWIPDDYEGARQQALQSGLPIVIDMWAPWCHSCLSMTHYVLQDERMTAFKERFVWLAIDTDKEVNTHVTSTFTISSWPTFLVIDAESEAILAVQMGTATVEEFSQFLQRGESAYVERHNPGATWLVEAQAGDAAFMQRQFEQAAGNYRSALAALPAGDANRSRIAVSAMSSLARIQQWSQCADVAYKERQNVPVGASTEYFAYLSHACANHLAADSPIKAQLLASAVEMLEQLIANPPASLAVDDLAGAMVTLRGILDTRGEHDAARNIAGNQKDLLDAAARAATDPLAASTFNYGRSEVYSYLGIAGELIEEMKLQVAALPEEFDPPYRLAQLYMEEQRWDEAQAAASLAAELSYGPRQCRIYALIGAIQRAKGDLSAEKTATQATLRCGAALPKAQQDHRIVRLMDTQQARLDEITEAAN